MEKIETDGNSKDEFEKFSLKFSDAQIVTVLRFNNAGFNLLLRMKTKAVIWQLFLSFQGFKTPTVLVPKRSTYSY